MSLMRDRVDGVFADRRVQQAFRYITDHESRIEADQIRLTQVPAPPFGEAERARHFTQELIDLGLRPFTDSIGNVIAGYDLNGHNPVVIGAHLVRYVAPGVLKRAFAIFLLVMGSWILFQNRSVF